MLRGSGMIASIVAVILALAFAGCSTTQNAAALRTGMTPDQTIDVMGQPDLKDTIADPSHPGATVLRYVWLDSGRVAVFDASNRVASIQPIETPAATKRQIETANQPPPEFDPINTPLDYAFYPIRAGFMYLGAGLNCVLGGGCHKPEVPSPGQG